MTAQVSDANRGNNGVLRTVLQGGYASPFTSLEIEGTGPGGNGDGVWTFDVPPQIGRGGQTLTFTLTAYDHTGRSRISGQQSVQIIAHDIESARNGLPDWWLMQHFGNLNQTRAGDPNHNRVPNILEYLLGSDPNNPNEAPLRGYWRFNASDAQDSSVWANHATLTGGEFGEPGVMGGRFLRFKAANNVLNVGFNPTFKAVPMTIMAYFRLQGLSGNQAVLWDNLTGNAGMRLSVTEGGELQLTTRGSEGEFSATTDFTLETGAWYHIAISLNAAELTLYLNAEPIMITGIAGRYTAPDLFTPTTMGNRLAADSAHRFHGDLDEIMFWNRTLNQYEVAIASGQFLDYAGGSLEWRTGHREGEYGTQDHGNFVWNDVDETLLVTLPNRAQQTVQPYAYQFIDRKSGSFHFSFETTIHTPGFEAPFRFGLKQNPSANWGSDQGLSATFVFRSSGFRLELFMRDGANSTQTHEWSTGFRLDNPARWVKGAFVYDSIALTLTFALRDSDSGELLAEHSFTNVQPFAANMDRFVVSSRGDPFVQSGFSDSVVGHLRNVSLHPVALGPLLPPAPPEDPWRTWARGAWGNDADDLALTDDPGSHGIPLAWRYAFAMNAAQPDRQHLPIFHLLPDPGTGDRYLHAEYRARKDVTGLRFILQASEDMQNWSTVTHPVPVEQRSEGDADVHTIRDTTPLGDTPRFIRLGVEVE